MALIGQVVSEKEIFENGGRTDGRTDGHWLDGYTISSPCEPNGSGELKYVSAIFHEESINESHSGISQLQNFSVQNLQKGQ